MQTSVKPPGNTRAHLVAAWMWTAVGVIFTVIPTTAIIGVVALIVAAVLWLAVAGRRSAAKPPAEATPMQYTRIPRERVAPEVFAAQEARRRASAHGADATQRQRPAAVTGAEKAAIPALPRVSILGAPHSATADIEGEFARIPAIVRAIGRRPKVDQEIVLEDLIAELHPEPTNPYDPHAVMVVINGQHVGYLGREDAREYQPALLTAITAGFAPATRARLWMVARRDYKNPRATKYHANVRVALGPAHLLFPLNDPPAMPHSILPWGSGLQVTGEENHQEVLTTYETPKGDAVVIGTFHVISAGTQRAPKELIEVRVDGERVGQLTSATSQHFIPTVQHLNAQGLATAAWMRVKGSPISKQVVIQATKAHELPSEWFVAPVTVPRIHGTTAAPPSEAERDDAEIRRQRPEAMWEDG